MRRVFWLPVIAGLVGVAVFGFWAWKDWGAFQEAYRVFEDEARKPDNIEKIFVAEARQNMHRINLFAEGVWTLLCAILATVGALGLRRGEGPKQ